MNIPKSNKLQKAKWIGSSYFFLVGLVNLLHTLVNSNDYVVRDLVILIILSLPLIINKRIFYLGFGIITASTQLIMLILFVFLQNPIRTHIDIPTFFFGCIIFTIGLLCALTLINVGTYIKDKKRFRII